MKKRLTALLLTMALLFSMSVSAWAAPAPSAASPAYAVGQTIKFDDDEVKGKLISVSLSEKDSGSANYKKLEAALAKGGGSQYITVKISKPGKYKISKNTLKLRSNTTLDLNGSTLRRTGGVQNLIVTSAKNGSLKSKGGYGLAKNIVVKNGTLDGNGGGSTPSCNLVNIGHTTNCVFYNVNFRNCRAGHLLEFSGCKGCRVEKCTFSGYRSTGSTSFYEAIQIDTSYKGGGELWNHAFKLDKTVCQDITVTGCTFLNYPGGVGEHHSLYGRHSKNITITNNRFLNTTKAQGCAIRCFGFDNAVVSGNVIQGNYLYGIKVDAGSAKVSNNVIGSASKAFTGYPIYFVYASCYTGSGTKKEYVKNGSITKNTIYMSKSGTAGIYLTVNSHVGSISDNTVTAKKGMGIGVISGSYAKSITGNVITSQDNGIQLTGASAANIDKNNIRKSGKFGIYLNGKSKVTGSIQNNTIKSTGKAVKVVNGSSAKNIKNNN